jgi:micrococcal nuclease
MYCRAARRGGGGMPPGGQGENTVCTSYPCMAWWYRPYAPNDTTLANLEAEARTAKRGLWADAQPVPPWQWRKGKRQTAQASEPVATITPPPDGPIVGNQKSHIYHWAGCPDYDKVSTRNRITFTSREAAEAAGYRAAKNCR